VLHALRALFTNQVEAIRGRQALIIALADNGNAREFEALHAVQLLASVGLPFLLKIQTQDELNNQLCTLLLTKSSTLLSWLILER
jgi:hypothetical protein